MQVRTRCWRIAGSSPLARGTRRLHRFRLLRHWFIPARAGNTRNRISLRACPTVHPRSRGEHVMPPSLQGAGIGSSPLARGTPLAFLARRECRRFIPARAGNTGAGFSPSGVAPVHPRSRGEHITASSPTCARRGSSPLARGTRPRRRPHSGRHRFIPARAGNTPPPGARMTAPTVHPRSRGEHALTRDLSSRPSGSSPLARGTRRDPPRRVREPRFIPARAGNTPAGAGSRAASSVHPRSRGEHRPASRRMEPAAGSSPLARGTHFPELNDKSRFFR